MANKRMFTMSIVDSDAFLDMPLSTQALYFHLNMRADDDGFIGNPKRIMRLVGASDDDMKLLMAKSFVISFENGVIVIKHWRMHNTLSAGRYHETPYITEKKQLLLKSNGAYSLVNGEEIDDTRLIESSKRQVRRTLDEQKTDSDIDIDKEENSKGLDKEKNNNITPLTPLTGGEDSEDKSLDTLPEWNYDKHNNVENLKHVLNGKMFKRWEYLAEQKDLWCAVKSWMAYKDARKPRSSNHYVSADSICKFLSKVVNNCEAYGTEVVVETINDTIGQGYQGIVWDWCEKAVKSKQTNKKHTGEGFLKNG